MKMKANSPHPPEISCIFLVLEFCAGGNLASYINQHGRVQEQIVRRIMQQLGSSVFGLCFIYLFLLPLIFTQNFFNAGAGLEILHSHHIIHRDLKPEVKDGRTIILFLPYTWFQTTDLRLPERILTKS